MKGRLIAVCLALAVTVTLRAQTPTITAVYGEAGTTSPLCPGGIAFVQGTNLGGTATTVTIGTRQAYVFNAFNGTSLQIELPGDAPLGATTLKAGASAPFNITLVQYSPGLPVNNPGNLAYAYHFASGAPVTASFPATPNEQIAVLATGLGPTNPAFATGTSPNDSSAATLTLPIVNVAGKPVTVQSAFLQPNNPGFYGVLFTMRADVTTGSQNINIGIGGLTSNTGILPVATGPVISSVTNAASYIAVGPSRGIAQGAIFVIKGLNMGPTAISIAPNAFQNTTLSGTSVAVTVSGTTVAALMYYTSAGQIAALLPSNTPTGAGTVSVTYNSQAGPTSPVVVVPNTLGIFTVTSDGNGAGIVTYADYSLVSSAKGANCGGVYTTCGAANPGDALIIWATGLGAVNGSDAAGAGLGVNMTSLPLTVWLGNVAVTASYQGRSGCCIGEDQIVFTVPANTPTGCSVPLSVQIGNAVSNNVALAVAPSGSRTCTPTNTAFSAANVSQISTGAPTFTYGGLNLQRQDRFPGVQDQIHGEFYRFSLDPAVQPFIWQYIDAPPLGACQVFNSPNGQINAPLTPLTALNAGAQLKAEGSNGAQTADSSGGDYRITVNSPNGYFAPGTLTVSTSGGPDVPATSTSVSIPVFPTMTSPMPDATTPTSVTRANGMTVTWSGGSAAGYVELDGFSNTDNTGNTGISFQCSAPAATGSFTIPPSVLLMLPANSFAGLDFRPGILPFNISGTGLTLTQVTLQYDSFTPLAFK